MQPESRNPAAVTAMANFSDVSFNGIFGFPIESDAFEAKDATIPSSAPTLSPKLATIPALRWHFGAARACLCLFCRKYLSGTGFFGN
jgi:hypothetical protein